MTYIYFACGECFVVDYNRFGLMNSFIHNPSGRWIFSIMCIRSLLYLWVPILSCLLIMKASSFCDVCWCCCECKFSRRRGIYVLQQILVKCKKQAYTLEKSALAESSVYISLCLNAVELMTGQKIKGYFDDSSSDGQLGRTNGVWCIRDGYQESSIFNFYC